jgi:hypothetical protein
MVVFLSSQPEVPHASPLLVSQLVQGPEEVTTLIDGDASHGMPSFPEHISNLVLWLPTGMRTFYPGAKPRVR